jgi:hypothetical protein
MGYGKILKKGEKVLPRKEKREEKKGEKRLLG